MAAFQVKVGGTWRDDVELHRDTLEEVADELMDKVRKGDEIVAALPIICHLILQYHGGQFYDKNPNYIDFEMDVGLITHSHDVAKAYYTGCINLRIPGQNYIDRQEFKGDISVM